MRATVSMRTCFSILVLVLIALPASASATELPFDVRRLDAQRGEMELALRPVAIAALSTLDRVELTSFPLTNGEVVALQLERIDLTRLTFGLSVDGQPAPGLLEGLELSVWRGNVVGEADSQNRKSVV